jgi:hypothetical protein
MCVRARRLSGTRGSDRPQERRTTRHDAWISSQRLAWFTEPKLAVGERRMADQNSASWNRMISWLRDVEGLQPAT